MYPKLGTALIPTHQQLGNILPQGFHIQISLVSKQLNSCNGKSEISFTANKIKNELFSNISSWANKFNMGAQALLNKLVERKEHPFVHC